MAEKEAERRVLTLSGAAGRKVEERGGIWQEVPESTAKWSRVEECGAKFSVCKASQVSASRDSNPGDVFYHKGRYGPVRRGEAGRGISGWGFCGLGRWESREEVSMGWGPAGRFWLRILRVCARKAALTEDFVG